MARTVRDILADYEADLLDRLKSLRQQIIPLERELAEVRRARSAVSLVDHGPEQAQIQFPLSRTAGNEEHVKRDLSPPRSPYARLTIKQLVRKALDEHFERGATANELLDFFRDVYARDDVVRTSLSPQLSRLKQEGDVILIGQKWSLPTAQNRQVEADASEKAATSL